MAILENLVGRRFGRLTVVDRAENNARGGARWLCVCECGRQKTAQAGNLKNNQTQSCGCLHRELARAANVKHEMTGTKEYRTWSMMVQRCTNPKNERASRYAGRLCPKWATFENFFADMGLAPSPAHSLDRIDNDGIYEPSNCRWATAIEQANNKSNNRLLTYKGETHTASEWVRILGVPEKAFIQRIQRGWDVDSIFTKPYRNHYLRQAIQPAE